MPFSGTKKVSVYNPADGTVVQLNKLDSQGTFEKNPVTSPAADGSGFYAGYEAKFECMALDNEGFDQLEVWMQAETPVRLVTYGLDDHILWYEDTTIKVTKKHNFAVGNRNGFILTLEKKGGNINIQSAKNLLWITAGWADTDANNKADNYQFITSAGAFTNLFTGGLQKVTCTGDGNLVVETSFVYPIVGVPLSLFANLGANNNKICNISLQQYSYAAAYIDGVVALSSGILSVSTKASVYRLYADIITDSAALNGDIYEQDVPYLGTPQSAKSIIKY